MKSNPTMMFDANADITDPSILAQYKIRPIYDVNTANYFIKFQLQYKIIGRQLRQLFELTKSDSELDIIKNYVLSHSVDKFPYYFSKTYLSTRYDILCEANIDIENLDTEEIMEQYSNFDTKLESDPIIYLLVQQSIIDIQRYKSECMYKLNIINSIDFSEAERKSLLNQHVNLNVTNAYILKDSLEYFYVDRN